MLLERIDVSSEYQTASLQLDYLDWMMLLGLRRNSSRPMQRQIVGTLSGRLEVCLL